MPAKRGLVEIRQSDGTVIKVLKRGDERRHYVLSEDGYLLQNQGGVYYYATLSQEGAVKMSQVRAQNIKDRSSEAKALLQKTDKEALLKALETKQKAQKVRRAPMKNVGLFDDGFPSKGRQKALVVLVQYKDVKFTLDDPNDYFTRLMSEKGFSDYNATGCVEEYFEQCSMGKFTPEFDVQGPVTLSQNMSYYGGNDSNGNDTNPEKMVIEACQQLDKTVDFSQYDRDNDGFIDNVFVFYAGQGEASYGSDDSVWPHAWYVYSGGEQYYSFDGKVLDRYACSNEWEKTVPDGIGTFCHEFSHVMGLPDLYATEYTSSFTPGAWSVMDYGPYNNNGRTPPLYGVYERYSLGWIEPQKIDKAANITLKSIAQNDGCIIPTGDSNEFFLLENKQQTGADQYLPGHGMLIWHVDYDETVWQNNAVNNTPGHQYVDLEEADNRKTEATRAGDAFPGTSKKTSFTDTTTPNMKTWAGTALNLPITDIAEKNGIITFKVAGGVVEVDPPVALEASDIAAGQATLRWQKVPNATSYSVSLYQKSATGEKTYIGDWRQKDVGDVESQQVTGLTPESAYCYVVYAAKDDQVSEPSNEISFLTGEKTFDYFAPTATAASEVKGTSFVANWCAMSQADGYTLSVYTKTLGEPQEDGWDMTGGIGNKPAGWKTNTLVTYTMADFAGKAAPSLKLAKSGIYLQSPVYSKDITGLSFWQRGNNATEGSQVRVLAGAAESSLAYVAQYAVVNAAGGENVEVTDLPAGTRVVRLEYYCAGSGALALDDVTVLWGGEMVKNDVSLLETQSSETNLLVEGLQEETTYYYIVRGKSGSLLSLWSNEIEVTTLKDEQATAISAVSLENNADLVQNNIILQQRNVVFLNPCGLPLSVHDVSGGEVRVTYTGKKAIATLPKAGVYIIRYGSSVRKVVVR